MTTATKELISELKKGDNIIFQHYNGRGVLRITREDKTTKDGGKLTYPDYEIEIDERFDIYESPDKPDGYGGYKYDYNKDTISCFEMKSLHYGTGKAIQAFLRIGDEIGLHWIANSRSGYLYNLTCNHPNYSGQALYNDQCHLTIKSKSSKVSLYNMDTPELFIGDSICPDNSARMIRNY